MDGGNPLPDLEPGRESGPLEAQQLRSLEINESIPALIPASSPLAESLLNPVTEVQIPTLWAVEMDFALETLCARPPSNQCSYLVTVQIEWELAGELYPLTSHREKHGQIEG